MLTLDHVVVTTSDLDEACAAWKRLGFDVTPRGFHPFGTMNNLLVLGSTYVELFAFDDPAAFDAAVANQTMPADLGDATRRALETPDGPSMLAVTTADAKADLAAVVSNGVDVHPPLHFHRPVVLPDGTETAADVTVNFLANGATAVLPLFVSVLRNRESLWVSEWQRHPNGAVDIVEAVFTAPRPAEVAPYLGAILGDPIGSVGDEELAFDAGPARAIVTTPARCAERFGAVLDGGGFPDAPSFEALTIAVRDLSVVERLLTEESVPFATTSAGTIQVGREAGAGTRFEFVTAEA